MMQARPVDPYLADWRIDAGLVFGGSVVAFVLACLAWHVAELPWFDACAAVIVFLVDLPHVGQTLVRVSMEGEERAAYGRRAAGSLLMVGSIVAFALVADCVRYVVAAWLIAQLFHVTRQHYGMIVIYARKAGYTGRFLCAATALTAGCLAPVALRLSVGIRFSLPTAAYVPGDEFPSRAAAIVLAWLAGGGYVVFLVALGALLIADRRRRDRDWPALPAMSWATLIVAVALYNLAYLLVSDPVVAMLLLATFHGLQYHVVSWRRNAGARVRTNRPPQDAPLVVIALLGTTIAIAAGHFMLGAAIPLTLFFHHYYMDAVLWRRHGNRHLAADLGFAPS